MQSNPKKIWFPAKRYGWGWGFPCAWQGWLWLLAYVVLTTAGALYLVSQNRIGLFLTLETISTAIFITVVWMKGEKPRWRWGND